MIQRIQSVFLLMGAGLGVVLLLMHFQQSIINSEDVVIKKIDYNLFQYSIEDNAGEIVEEGTPLFPLILTAIILLAALVNIFLYKNRSLQATICRFLILASSALIVALIFDLDKVGGIKFMTSGDFINYLIVLLPVVMIILFFLANRAILKDDRLIRSADRIR